MPAIRFELGVYILQFSRGIQYPVQKPVEKSQVMERTGGNTWQVEDLGITISQFPIRFKNLPLADYNSLLHFHQEVINVAEHNFTYYDEEGDSHTVKCLTLKLKFPQTSYHRYSGELLLEVVG